MSIICTQLYEIKYSNLIQIQCTQLYGFKYYLILIIHYYMVWNNYSYFVIMTQWGFPLAFKIYQLEKKFFFLQVGSNFVKMRNIKTKILHEHILLIKCPNSTKGHWSYLVKAVKNCSHKKIAPHNLSRCNLWWGNSVHLENLFSRPKKVRSQAKQKGLGYFTALSFWSLFVCLFEFYGISTFVDYLMPNLFLSK